MCWFWCLFGCLVIKPWVILLGYTCVLCGNGENGSQWCEVAPGRDRRPAGKIPLRQVEPLGGLAWFGLCVVVLLVSFVLFLSFVFSPFVCFSEAYIGKFFFFCSFF